MVSNIDILYITGLYPPPETANGIRAYYFVRELVESGFNTIVVETVSRSDPSVGGFFGEKVIRMRLRSYSTFNRIYDFLYKLMFVRRTLKKLYSKKKPTAIIASWPSHEAILLGGYLSNELKVPLIVDIQDLSDYYSEMTGKPRAAMFSPIYRRIYEVIRRADVIITVTEPFEYILEKRVGRNDIHVIYNGVDMELYSKLFREQISDHKFSEYPVGVFVGDLSWGYHSLDRIITALALIKKRIGAQGTRIIIIGTGRLEKMYRDLASRLSVSDMLSFEGYLERKELIKALTSADYGVIGRPSINNLWNIASVRTTLYEYMAAGLPIFAFGPKYSYIRTLLNINSCGYYVPSDHPLNIAKGLAKFIRTIDSFDRQLIHQRTYKYSWSRLSKRFVTIIKNLIM